LFFVKRVRSSSEHEHIECSLQGEDITQLLGPLPNGPEADAQTSGDLGMSQATDSEQSSSLQPTFFNLALSQFARALHDRENDRTRAGEEATYLNLSNGQTILK